MSSDWPIAIGLNLGHDGGCAVICGDRITAVAEERLNRTRYSPGWHAALAYCLEATRVRLQDTGIVVFSCVGPRLPEGFTGGLDLFGFPAERIETVDHHLSHAYNSFCLSGFDEALVVVADGAGNDDQTESYFRADKHEVSRVGGNRSGRSRAAGIGATYEAITNFIGFHEQEAGKTMALAAFGDPNAFEVPLFDLCGTRVEGRLSSTHERGLIDFAHRAGLKLGEPHPIDDQMPRNLAAWVQSETERVLRAVVSELVSEHGISQLCLAGGVAMNCVANSAVRAATGAHMFVPPASSDRGQALGNALYGIHRLTGAVPRLRLGRDAFGREYRDEEIRLALRRHPYSGLTERHPRSAYSWRQESNPALVAAQMIADGLCIGWFDGPSELGARALGQRSILADPRNARTKDTLNRQIKHREWFRPFAPAVLAENQDKWFETAEPSHYMLYAVQTRPDRRDRLAAVTHVDGTARLQTVDPRLQPTFHKLISDFYAITGVPAVLNTSFNDREPIVETPAHAVSTFSGTDLDALVIGNYVAVKR